MLQHVEVRVFSIAGYEEVVIRAIQVAVGQIYRNIDSRKSTL